MRIKAIGFDIGGTLVDYHKTLNWSASYESALKFMCDKNDIKWTEEKDIIRASAIGMKTILINRGQQEKNFHQDYTISNLTEIIKLIEK